MQARLLHHQLVARRRAVVLGWAPWVGVALLCGAGGCQSFWEEVKGPGFPGWTGESVRGKNSEAKASGFFTSRKAEQIEKDLGGDF